MKFGNGLIAVLLLWSISLSAQHQETKYGSPNDANLPEWAQLMYTENADPGEVKEAYDAYYLTHDFIKNQHTQYYKHWLRNISRDHNGLFHNDGTIDREAILQNEAEYLQKKQLMEAQRGPTSQWSCIGPIDYDHDAAGRSYAPGAAHVYTVEQANTDANTLWCGTATAGIYKSTDYGATWTLMTRNLVIGGSRSIEIDHSNANIVYFAASGQVYKTTDAGNTWNMTGDASFQSTDHSVNDIVSDPTNANIIFLCTNDGLYRSINSGATYTLLQADKWMELEFHPTNNSIAYAVKQTGDLTEFYKSLDGGLTWTQKPNGWPVPPAGDEQKRTEIAVTPANPNLIVAQCTGATNGGSGLYGVYISNDAGENWTFQCCGTQPGGAASASNPNMMGYAQDGSSDGGQYYYDVALAISNTNANRMSLCGINHWMTTDGGVNWNCAAKWSQPGNAAYVHADIHDVRYFANDDIWIANDGGIWYSTDNGVTFNRRMYGIAGTDFWGFGAGFQDGELMVGGTYHNSTLLKDGNTYINGWISTAIGGAGGDNVRGYTNFGKEDVLYMDAGRRQVPHDRTVGFTDASLALQVNASYITGESSDMAFDPRNYNVIFIGNDTKLYRSENEGSSYDELYDFGEKVTSIAIGWDNPDVMYVCTWPDWWGEKKIFRSADGGNTFTQLTKPFGGSLWAPLDVTVSSSNADEIWLARCPQSGGYNSLDGEKVYHSTDGGQTWTNWDTTPTLNGEHITNIIHQRGTNGGVYIGTRRAVYYRNNTMADWALFNNNLPARTFSTRLIPYYRGNKLRNGTDRSVWEVDFYENSAPDAQIAMESFTAYCTGDEIQFKDHSAALDNATYSWSFPGGTPATSSARNPVVSFNSEGTFSITLTVTDANGTDTQTLIDVITVEANCIAETVPGNAANFSTATSEVFKVNDDDELDFGATTDFTVMGWIKTTSTTSDGAFWSKKDWDSGGNDGWVLSMSNGEMWANVGDGSGNRIDIRPNDTFNDGEWHHIALSCDRDGQARLYANGKLIGQESMAAIGNIDNSYSLAFGADTETDWQWDGQTDEVSIWQEALSQDRIRELMHLTLTPDTEANLVAYYQFNRPADKVTDRAGSHHGDLLGGATRMTSSGPFGGGTSFRTDVTSGGSYDFTGTGLTLEFPASGTYPDGEIVVSRLDLQPDQLPNANTPSTAYWVIRNCGNNPTFSELSSIVFDQIGTVGAAQDASEFKLYKRNSNAHGATWGSSVDFADAATVGANGSVTFSNNNGQTSFSQFIIMDESSVLPVDWLYFHARLTDDKEVQLDWATVAEQNSAYFLIERSAEGETFEAIATIPARGNSTGTLTYTDLDKQPLRGTSYYRLKQFDQDGSFQYSELRSITFDALPNHFAVYPNPIQSGDNLQIISDLNEDLQVQIYNAKGRLVINTTIPNGIGEVSTAGLSSGTYLYKIIGGKKLKMGKVVVD